ncbi:signal peptidase I [Arthrobacter sp. I2-34]|uniref:Signal peptidase I n=1 Tax=Arthrobacter hankyongi TaxID=2904801 RepID=A0ABS9L6L6_9MICC|nr:signal peptidase I [Arthrobacter hankyongi]MCG2622316.1 signal peptidase I [Arthrobacter hankyongi]
MCLALVAAVLASAVVRATLVDVYYIPSDSMEPLLQDGDRVLVSRTDFRGGPIRRGDLVVFDGRGSFAPFRSGNSPLVDGVLKLGQWLGVAGSSTVYVKRVVGLPGDRVACCAPDGRLTINGMPVSEGYVYPGDAPSTMKFDVEVPADRLWLMGDHRSVSADSRSLLGAPGGGMVPVDRVIGRPLEIIWPLERGRQLERAPLGGAAATDEGQ